MSHVTDIAFAQRVLRDTAEDYCVPLEELLGRDRRDDLLEARRVAIARIWQQTLLSQEVIGALVGGRDRSTIAYYLQAHRLRERAA